MKGAKDGTWALDEACERLGINRIQLIYRLVTDPPAKHVTDLPEREKIYMVDSPSGRRYTLQKPDTKPVSEKKEEPPRPRDRDEFIDIIEAAEQLALNPLDVPALLVSAKIDHFKTAAGKYKISQNDMDHYLQSRDERSQAPAVVPTKELDEF